MDGNGVAACRPRTSQLGLVFHMGGGKDRVCTMRPGCGAALSTRLRRSIADKAAARTLLTRLHRLIERGRGHRSTRRHNSIVTHSTQEHRTMWTSCQYGHVSAVGHGLHA